MTRRTAASWFTVAAIVASAVCVVVLGPIERGPGFHRYADQRTWLGIPHAGDVLSNLPFVIIGVYYLRSVPALGLAVAWIGVGSSIYHWSPGDHTLALDWAPIAVTLMIVLGAVIHDRLGPRPGVVVQGIGPIAAVLSVGYWLMTGGTTDGGDMAPYVALQLLGVALPPLLAVIAPGQIATRYLLAAVGCFVLARVLGAYDAELLEAIAVSGHSLKHLAAAAAAAFVLNGVRHHSHHLWSTRGATGV